MFKKNKVLMKPHKLLNMKSQECDFSLDYEEIRKDISKLKDVFSSLPRAKGLSAVQIGIAKQICVMRVRGNVQVLCNPKIKHSFLMLGSNEGCESCGEDRYIVNRPVCGIVTYLDPTGQEKTKFFLRDKMRVISHEIDHMNGVLISDCGEKWWCNNIYKQVKKGKSNEA